MKELYRDACQDKIVCEDCVVESWAGTWGSAQLSSVNYCWLFLNQHQRDAEPEFSNVPNGPGIPAEDTVR